jgi:rhamnose utilization protein RhaD (predicted bifunctional aldolase and dehydrogenase)
VRKPSQLEALRELSAEIGGNPLLTQASAGNTSIKIDGRLWVKASGKWLANALQEDIFIPLNLSDVRTCVRQRRTSNLPVRKITGEELKPSLETPMHAVLPQRVVVHVHSVNTLARAVRSDAQEHFASRMHGLRWQWIPYVLSGLPLALQIEAALRRSPGFDVLVLGNHGLTVCGDDCRSVALLLKQVELRLGSIPRQAPRFDNNFLVRIAQGSSWRVPEHTRLHSLASDEGSRRILSQGSLYPCQAIVLGGPDPWAPFYPGLYSEVRRNLESSVHRPFLVIKDKGVLLSKRIISMELETLIGLAEVVQRVESDARIRYLTKAECEEISLLDADRTEADPVRQARIAV